MKALTVWEPYAYAIGLGSKLIENRTWATLHRGPLAIHAAKRVASEDDVVSVADRLLEQWTGDYVAGADEAQYQEMVSRIYAGMRPGHVVAVAMLERMVERTALVPAEQRVWWNGPVGWLFSRVVRLETPVPCKGAQGLWELPEDVEAQVRAQLRPTGQQAVAP